MSESQLRAEQARQILDNPAFNDALRMMQESIDRQRCATAWNETKKREHLHLKERALIEMQLALRNVLAAGFIEEPKETMREKLAKTVANKWKRN